MLTTEGFFVALSFEYLINESLCFCFLTRTGRYASITPVLADLATH